MFKTETINNPAYLKWLCEHGCANCGKPSEPHHLPNRLNLTRRARDDYAVPLCRICHRYYHDMPECERFDLSRLLKQSRKFWKEYNKAATKKSRLRA